VAAVIYEESVGTCPDANTVDTSMVISNVEVEVEVEAEVEAELEAGPPQPSPSPPPQPQPPSETKLKVQLTDSMELEIEVPACQAAAAAPEEPKHEQGDADTHCSKGEPASLIRLSVVPPVCKPVNCVFLKGEILPISLNLNFTPNTLGCYGLRFHGFQGMPAYPTSSTL